MARIYGLFTIKTDFFDNLNIVIMQNTKQLKHPTNKNMTFDIKGSTTNRKVKGLSRFVKSNLGCKTVMKDVNYLEIN